MGASNQKECDCPVCQLSALIQKLLAEGGVPLVVMQFTPGEDESQKWKVGKYGNLVPVFVDDNGGN